MSEDFGGMLACLHGGTKMYVLNIYVGLRKDTRIYISFLFSRIASQSYLLNKEGMEG